MTTLSFKDQIAIITGAASGIGFSIAKALAVQGAKLALLDMNVQALSDFTKNSSDISYIVDVTQESEVKQTIEKIGNDFGRIDILINSAGITGVTNDLKEMSGAYRRFGN